MFIAALFILEKQWKESKCSSVDEQIKCDMSIQWNIINNKKKGSTKETINKN